ncbi:metallophosphoesterase family protein [Tengunoibacter tsumagoiensis]|uniref:Calcineurin-like phosphoesterase domain-containing protein n=1 Tax=Tengunoibacter tsumagoiensis TaxID=2014871 RepID=A0A401ZV90_9CHLR|nr:metallophosphoesterase [Tengunoibacter tsumagoiensis]GCE10829.1 hypothetical protein KTT_06880 [Tengunoibacter tsumagoiensis]
MNIAVFADIHGRMLLAFKLCARWQQETGQRIDLILQAGDLGAYPSEDTLDWATFRQAKIDPSELGFLLDFVEYDDEVAAMLSLTNCPLLFVRGNHEAHDWLDELEEEATDALFSIDVYQRIWCLRTGIPYTFTHQHESITLLGIGRIGAPASEPDPSKTSYIQAYEQQRLADLCAPTIDILLTHDAPVDFQRSGQGMEEITTLLQQAQPAYHFFGHYGGPARIRLAHNGYTQSCKLADLTWDLKAPGHRLNTGSMGLLNWQSVTEHHFEILTAPWLKKYSVHHWKYV